MADRLGNDAHYVVATARLFGWRVVWRAGGRLRSDRDGRRVRALFTPAGGFRHARMRVGGQAWQALGQPELVWLLEGEGPAVRSSA
ncbi:hypothetical protein [Streptacidiphilus neutrinimicus]|uniref:hypothetical protein n=1 Tax=Streptacidiphilus neutrinimicus TaxID=105420 RepID=UPI0005A768BB|nr:hypothetical protein [Streptacidiphilus neutrinimicus]